MLSLSGERRRTMTLSFEPQKQKTILKQVATLQRMGHEQLKDMWRTLYGTEPPAFTAEFLKKRLIFRIQELAFGGISQAMKDRMNEVLDEYGYDEIGARPKKFKRQQDAPVPGTRLIREWHGEMYEVVVMRGGYNYMGRTYKSLSSIARAITGTQWNGCAFFGLRSKAKKQE
jgi:hypothetical protein